MEALTPLVDGFAVAMTLQNLLYCLAGALLGTLVGILPGISPVVAIAMLLPLTFQVPPLVVQGEENPTGPLTRVTSCGTVPAKRHVNFVPRLTLTRCAPYV